jgi:hypothetical protein
LIESSYEVDITTKQAIFVKLQISTQHCRCASGSIYSLISPAHNVSVSRAAGEWRVILLSFSASIQGDSWGVSPSGLFKLSPLWIELLQAVHMRMKQVGTLCILTVKAQYVYFFTHKLITVIMHLYANVESQTPPQCDPIHQARNTHCNMSLPANPKHLTQHATRKTQNAKRNTQYAIQQATHH